jgi:nicotinate-nucleotide pyrophosphorylase (carboxylating)
MSIGDAVKKAKQNASHTIRVEVEVENLGQLQQVLDAGAEIVLLDNMDVELMTRAVEMCRGRAVTEASGGITLETVRDVAATGVDIISVGALTHSVKALDVSLDMVR